MSNDAKTRFAGRSSRMLAIAHRGYSAKYPENSTCSYVKAVEAKADYIESDVRLSLDEVPVAIHDADLGRLSGRDAEIARLSRADLLNAERFDGERFLTTEQVLTLAGDQIRVLLDFKTTDMLIVQKTYEVVDQTGMQGRVCFGLRNLAQIDFLCSITSQIAILGMPLRISAIDQFCRKKIDAIRIWEDWYHDLDFPVSPMKIWVTVRNSQDGEVGEITGSRLEKLDEENIEAVILNDPSLITGII